VPLELLAEPWLSEKSPLPIPANNIFWTQCLSKTDGSWDQKMLEFLERLDGKFRFKAGCVWPLLSS
jgi:hypothetical protein